MNLWTYSAIPPDIFSKLDHVILPQYPQGSCCTNHPGIYSSIIFRILPRIPAENSSNNSTRDFFRESIRNSSIDFSGIFFQEFLWHFFKRIFPISLGVPFEILFEIPVLILSPVTLLLWPGVTTLESSLREVPLYTWGLDINVPDLQGPTISNCQQGPKRNVPYHRHNNLVVNNAKLLIMGLCYYIIAPCSGLPKLILRASSWRSICIRSTSDSQASPQCPMFSSVGGKQTVRPSLWIIIDFPYYAELLHSLRGSSSWVEASIASPYRYGGTPMFNRLELHHHPSERVSPRVPQLGTLQTVD